MKDEFKYWLAFDFLSGVGLANRRITALYEHFGSLKEAWAADLHDLREVPGLPEKAIHDFAAVRDKFSLEKPLAALSKHKIKAFSQLDPLYPQALLALPVPPLILYVKGEWDLSWFEKSIGIVGTREASEYALNQTNLISSSLASIGFTVVSGLALGIDAAAHLGALNVSGGKTVAVLANGVDRAIPPSNRSIYDSIAERGMIISEYPPERLPEKGYFPARNRIIAALSKSVLVCEAGEKSGALITAEKAIELGRRVFGLVGSVNNKNTEGIHKWIRKGRAGLITSAKDILEELNLEENASQMSFATGEWKVPTKKTKKVQESALAKSKILISKPRPELSQVEAAVYACLSENSTSVDKLIENTGLPVAKVNSVLLTLQLKKLIARDPSGAVILAS